MTRRFALAVLAAVQIPIAAAQTLPPQAADIHLGVASCAASVCHGRVAPAHAGVRFDEYRLWSDRDFHARAYQVLGNEPSRRMARKLGLADARTAPICLDCHADNIDAARRGPQFQLSDGIGCEGCHGGAQRWLTSHTEPGRTHRDNVARGMYPTDEPYARARLCLSCHMGSADKLANHQIMAAGHPRLSFELDTFSANQPAHYRIDADYERRKGHIAPGYLWLVGQVENARQWSALIERHLRHGVASELAIYDCHACHQPMRPLRDRPDDFSAVLPPGSLRLLDHSYDMLAAMFAVLLPERSGAWDEAVRDLHRASADPRRIGAAGAALTRLLEPMEQQLRASPPTAEQLRALRRHIAAQAAAGRYADFSSAEQAFLALESLSYALGDRPRLLAPLDAIFKTVADEQQYRAADFAAACRALAP